jgi:hypothetical protein
MAITREEAFNKGYLKNKKIKLKPVIRGGQMVNDSAHVNFFQYEGASNWFQLPTDKKNQLVNPFDSTEEQEFFEGVLDINLSIHTEKDNFWKKTFVKVMKDYNLMHDGYEFNLSDPMDVIRYKITKLQDSVAPSLETQYSRPSYRFALVDEEIEEERKAANTQDVTDAYIYFGEIRNSAVKMRDFLGMYFNEKNEFKFVPVDAEKQWLQKEIKDIIETDLKTFLKLKDDEDAPTKLLILQGIKAGSIVKEGRNKYTILGEGVHYTYLELISYLKKAAETKEDVYLKLKAQIKMNKE